MVWGCTTESNMNGFVSAVLPALLETFATLFNWTLLTRCVKLTYGKRFRANCTAATAVWKRNSLHPFHRSFLLSSKKRLVSSKLNGLVPCAGKGWRQLEGKRLVLDSSCVVLPISGISQHTANTAWLGNFQVFVIGGKRRWSRMNTFHRDIWILIMSVLGSIFHVQAATCG